MEEEYTEEQLSTLAKMHFGWMRRVPLKESFSVTLSHDQISELERLVRGYTEALAQYNTLSPGKQMTLDTLNEVWEQIDKAIES